VTPPNDRPAPPDNKLDLTVVVSGDRVPVAVNPHQQAEAIAREALREAGAADQNPAGYLLTFNDQEIAGDTRISDLGLSDGDVLYLSPRQAIGG
jgi:hypothetical protein